MNIADLIKTYPRIRPPVSAEFSRVYEQVYKDNRSGKGLLSHLSQQLESWMHRKVASCVNAQAHQLLEIGGGTLNHVDYEQNTLHYDIIEPLHILYQDNPKKSRIRHFYNDIKEIPETIRYNRIISVAVLEHIVDLPDVLRKCTTLLEKDGVFQAGIPSEGGLLWGMAWRCSMGLSFKLRTGLDYGELMRHEHVSNADEIIALVQHFFKEVTVKRFPLRGGHSSLYCYIEARN